MEGRKQWQFSLKLIVHFDPYRSIRFLEYLSDVLLSVKIFLLYHFLMSTPLLTTLP